MLRLKFDMKRIIQIDSWNEFQTYLLIAAFLAGFFGLFFPQETSRAASVGVPWWVLLVWYTGLVVGSTLSLIGSHLRFESKIHVEIIGLSILSFVTSGYSAIISVVSNRPFSYSVLVIVFFCIACVIRMFRLYGKIKDLRKSGEVTL